MGERAGAAVKMPFQTFSKQTQKLSNGLNERDFG